MIIYVFVICDFKSKRSTDIVFCDFKKSQLHMILHKQWLLCVLHFSRCFKGIWPCGV